MSKKYSFLHRYLSHVRKAPEQLQEVHAVLFSIAVTALLGAAVLYFDYGFWHERYTKSDDETLHKIEEKSDSPITMFSSLFDEAKDKLQTIQSGGGSILEGKKSYSKKEEFLRATSTESEQ